MTELVDLLDEPSWTVRRAVVAALARLGRPAVEPLCNVLLGSRTHEARLAAAVEALATSSGENTDDVVLGLLREGQSVAVQCDAAQILGRRACRGAVPSLARLLEGSDDNVAVAAIEALGAIGDGGTVEPLIGAVASPSFFRAFAAILPLGRSADPRALQPLVALLGDPRYAMEATRALGHSAQLAATAPLVALLVSKADDLVRAAAGALARLRVHREARFDVALHEETKDGSFAARARRRLRDCRSGARATERLALGVVLGWLQDDEAIAELVELFRTESGDAEAVRAALDALGVLAEPRLLFALQEGDSAQRLHLLTLIKPLRAGLLTFVACLEDADPRVRAKACLALSRIGDVSVVRALFGRIADVNAHASQAALAAIQALGGVETRTLALEGASSIDPRHRRAALRIIAYFGFPEGLALFVTALSDPEERIRDAAIYGLPFLDDPGALAVLLEASESATAHTRATAMRALGQTNGGGAVPANLRRGLLDVDPWVRYYACQSLGRLGVEEALPEVIALIDDPAGQVRVAAIEAISKLGDGQATAVLERASASADLDIRRVAILGLGSCKRAEALSILLKAARSDDSTTRLYALAGLAANDDHAVTRALVEASSDPVPLVRSAAQGLLSGRAGAEATRWLIARLGATEDRKDALAALRTPVVGRIATILSALETARPPLANLLMTVLARMHSPEGESAIEATLTFANVHARRSAALALTALDSADSRTILDRLKLVDPDDEVRRISAAVLH